ncbi:MAG TPA: hypothetical protein VFX89_13645 [Gammaproteobacteria bacterium]|nr:hypothetical protein [Gammaproteobacteria bacterium]
MNKLRVFFAALLLSAVAGTATAEAIDLSDARAVERLRASNPDHYAKIVQILAGLREQPSRVEQGWLQTAFGARDVETSGLVLLASYPPKQRLEFTLDDAVYRLDVVRADLRDATLLR